MGASTKAKKKTMTSKQMKKVKGGLNAEMAMARKPALPVLKG